jgi:hypothetical protein
MRTKIGDSADGSIVRLQQAGLECVQLNGFCASSLQQIFEFGDGLPPTFSRFIPFKVIATLGMVLIPARQVSPRGLEQMARAKGYISSL